MKISNHNVCKTRNVRKSALLVRRRAAFVAVLTVAYACAIALEVIGAPLGALCAAIAVAGVTSAVACVAC